MIVTPHLGFPLRRTAAGAFVAVEQRSARHLQDQADVLVRTRPGSQDATPELGLRELVARLGPAAPEVLAAIGEHVQANFLAEEDASALAERVRNVAVQLVQEEESS